MRLHTILLLLLFLQFTAGATPCDPTLIKGPPAADYEFKANELTCTGGKEINIAGKAYDKLKCEPDGWKHENAALDPEQKAEKDLNIECKAKACDESYIKGVDYEYKITKTDKVLTCKDGKEIEIPGHTHKYDIIHCDKKNGWKTANGELTPDQKANEELNIACKAKDPPPSDKCVKKLIKGVTPPEFTFNNKVLKCTNSKQIMVEGKTTPFDELKCDETEGWKNGANKINIDAEKELKIACKAKANAKCASKLIARIRIPEDGKYDNNKLTCTDANKAIDYDKKLYPEVTCDENDGWTSGPKKFGVNADSPFYGSCVLKACHQSLITGFEEAKMKPYDAATTKKLECKESFELLSYNKKGEAPVQTKELTCDPADKWKTDAGAATTILATDELIVKCEIKACHKDLIDGTADKSVLNELKCADATKKLKIQGDLNWYNSLKCDGVKWFDPAHKPPQQTVQTALAKFTADCVPKPAACSYHVPGSAYDKATKTLTCHPGQIDTILVMVSQQYTSLTCDGAMWTGEGSSWGIQIPADRPLIGTCKQSCKTTADVDYKFSSDGSYAVTCKGPAMMEYDDGSVQPVKVMTCSMTGGWKKDGVDIQKPSDTPLQELKCNKVCNKHQKPGDADANGVAQWKDGLTDLAQSIEEPGKVRFECNKKLIGDDKNVIKLNGKLVNSHLYCDPNGGYTDFYGTKLADATDTVKIDCVNSLCDKSSPSLCLAIESAGKMPEGHRCSGNEPSPFSITDDPNQLNCKKNGNLNRIFDHTSNPPAFIDETIVCKEKSDWYKYGDSEQKAISKPELLLCLHLRCNACKQLKGTTDKEKYVPGTTRTCATHKCANDFWKIKTVSGNEEEYAGEVTCSAKEGSDGKWVIDENSASPTAIAEGQCITSVKTCTEAVKLETACKAEWKGCSTITLNDDNAVTCPVGKMFYMQRGTANLEEGAESIKCDKTKGVWIVTRSGGNDELRRGGTVVCADSNPAPTTTTTEAPKNPCDICPKKDDFLKICDTCEDKDLKTKDIEARCEAYVEFATVTKFETDNKGPVEGKLFCGKPDYIWKDEKGNAVGKFATYKSPPNDETKKREQEAQTGLIYGGVIGGVVILIIIAGIIIWTIVITRRRRLAEDDKDEETKKRMLEEGKKRKKQRGDNDEILDEVSVDAPSEIKL